MTCVDSLDTYSLSYPIVIQFEANRCVVSITNVECYMLYHSPGQTITDLEYRSKGCSLPWDTISNTLPPKQIHTSMPHGLLHDTLSPKGIADLAPY